MKENSIEETKKQLELILKVRKEHKEIIECIGGSCMNCDPDIKALVKSIEILSDYKRVLKENEELKKYKEYYSSARQLVDNNYIQKQKVKEVIKELEDNIYRIKKQYSNGGENCNTVYLENLAQVKILKQILKEVE